MSKDAARAAWTWMRSDNGLLLWAVLVGIASGLLAVVMKQSVGGLRVVMFTIQSWVGGSWFLALGPILGLAATAYVVQRVLGGDHPGPGIPSTLHAISTRRGRMKRTWMFAPVLTSVLSVGFGGSGIGGSSHAGRGGHGFRGGLSDASAFQASIVAHWVRGSWVARRHVQGARRGHSVRGGSHHD